MIYPIVRSVAADFGSEPGPTSNRIGAYLVLVGFHTTYIASAMFLTSMASNPLAAEYALKIAHVELTWLRWLAGSIVPGLIALIVAPLLLLRWCRPEIRDTAPARELTRAEFGRMGLSARLFHSLAGLAWPVAAMVLVAAYLYIHYTFASMTAQLMALYPAFLSAMLAAGVPPMVAALSLAYFSSLNAGITHYGTGSAPVFFAQGYVRQGAWWRFGLLLSLVNLAIWLGIGFWWWRLVGLW